MAQSSTTVRNSFVAAKTALDTLESQTRGDRDLYPYVQSAVQDLKLAADVFHARGVNDPNLRRGR